MFALYTGLTPVGNDAEAANWVFFMYSDPMDSQKHDVNIKGSGNISELIPRSMLMDEILVILNGRRLSFDVPPQIINDRTLVPLRTIFEALGATVDWNEDTQTVTAKKDNTVVSLTIGNTSPTINGQVITIDQPGIIRNGRTLVPLRFVAESFGVTVDWDAAARTVNITT